VPGPLVDEVKRSLGLLVALGAAVAWAVLAARTPSNTYHFAPMVVAAAWVVFDGYRGAGITHRRAVSLASLGFAIAVVATIILEVKGDLDGPVFWEHGDDAPVLVEHVLFSFIGAVAGLLLAVRQAARPPVAA
jgi:hypothetical protein